LFDLPAETPAILGLELLFCSKKKRIENKLAFIVMTCCVGWGTARNFDDYTSKCPTVGEPLLIGPQGALNSGGLDFCVLIFWNRKIKSDSGGMCFNGVGDSGLEVY